MLGEIARWLLIIAGGLVAYTILYVVGWNTIESIAPARVERYNLHFVLKDIRKYFGFLLQEGYEISDQHYSYKTFGNWIVTLKSKECKIVVVQDRRYISVSLAPHNARPGEQFGLEAMVDFVTHGQKSEGLVADYRLRNKRKQFERLANLLRQYHDQIVPYLQNNNPWESPYHKYKDELITAQRQFYDRILGGHFQRRS
jgi:hypothetical protein